MSSDPHHAEPSQETTDPTIAELADQYDDLDPDRASTNDDDPIRQAIIALRDDKSQLVVLDLDHHYDRKGRSFLVTDVVTESFDDPDDPRETKHAIRLQGYTGDTDLIYALLLTIYPDHHRAVAHCLESPNAFEAGGEYTIHAIDIIEPDLKWVLIPRASANRRFHRPDPLATAHGDAYPACDIPLHDTEPTYRFVTRETVAGNLYPCRNCFHNRTLGQVTALECPTCERSLPEVILEGKHNETVKSVFASCPSCDFAGVIPLVQ